MITDQEIEKNMMTIKVIWFSMLMSLAVYLIVGSVTGPRIHVSVDENIFGIIKMIFYVLAIITLLASRFVRGVILSGKARIFQHVQVSRQPALQRYQSAMIMSMALSESIGIYGLVLFFLGKNPADLYLLTIISAIAMFMNRPDKVDLTSMLQEQDKE